MLKICEAKAVSAKLIEAHEINTSHTGLRCVARYEVDGIPFAYTVEFWSKHAPVRINADIVTVSVADDAPMIYVHKNGKPMLDKEFNMICTRRIVIMCPVKERKDGNVIYYNGHDPLSVAQRFVNNWLRPCKFGCTIVDIAKMK